MANSKRRCRTCKAYTLVDEGTLLNGGYYCGRECIVKYAIDNKHKGAKIKHTAQKKALKDNDKAFRLKCAQSAFNAFIRKRDELLDCISCDKTKDWHGQWHCGHFKTVGARPDIRFNEDNAARQCSQCNNFLSGNIIEYKKTLELRIGKKRVAKLDEQSIRKYSCEELKVIELKYKAKLKAIE